MDHSYLRSWSSKEGGGKVGSSLSSLISLEDDLLHSLRGSCENEG